MRRGQDEPLSGEAVELGGDEVLLGGGGLKQPTSVMAARTTHQDSPLVPAYMCVCVCACVRACMHMCKTNSVKVNKCTVEPQSYGPDCSVN